MTADTFSHTPNTQRNNTKAVFTSEKLDKLRELSDALKDSTINNAKYYASNSVTASDTQGNLTRNPKTATHTNNSNETVTNTSNGNFEQKLLSNRNLPAVVLAMNPRIDEMIAPIGGAYQTLLTPATK